MYDVAHFIKDKFGELRDYKWLYPFLSLFQLLTIHYEQT